MGGRGGDALDNSAPGQGGSATTTATGATSGTGSLNITALAYGWQGGIASSGSSGKGGDASATATGTGPSGIVMAMAQSAMGDNYHVSAQAMATIVNGTSLAMSATSEGQSIKNLDEAQGKQAVAFGTALPNQSGIDTLLAQHQTVSAAFNGSGTVLGYGVLGGSTLSSQSSMSMLDYSLNIQNLNTDQHLLVGLLDSRFTGLDATSLEFVISGQGSPLFDTTFDNGASAQAFFTDNVLDLGLLSSIAGGSSDLAMDFGIMMGGANDTSFDFNFIYGPTTPAPIPGTALLLGSGLVGLFGLRRKYLK